MTKHGQQICRKVDLAAKPLKNKRSAEAEKYIRSTEKEIVDCKKHIEKLQAKKEEKIKRHMNSVGKIDEELEFYSIIMPDGELTSRLKDIKVGDEVAMSARPVGSLVLSSLRSKGKRLFMLSTGTGVAPFASLIREEKTYRNFDEVYLTQTCRYATDLQYAEDRVREAKECPLVGEEAQKKLRLYSSVTREPYQHEGRITNLIESGKLFTDLGIPGLNPETDRIMICGSLAMLKDTQAILDAAGLSRGSGHVPGDYSWEKAFSG